MQDVFLKIHQHVDTLKDVRKLEGWIYQITRNAIIDAYRSRKQETPLEAAEVLDLPQELPDDDVVSELLTCLRSMVRSLPEPDRQALVLTEYQGLTQRELAERLACPFLARNRACSVRGKNSNSSSWGVVTSSWTGVAASSTISRVASVAKQAAVALTNSLCQHGVAEVRPFWSCPVSKSRTERAVSEPMVLQRKQIDRKEEER